LGSFVLGGHVGTGRAFRLLEAVIVLAEAAEEVWVEATAPVRARTTTNARTMIFMDILLWSYNFLGRFTRIF